jgi:hypothetical protein
MCHNDVQMLSFEPLFSGIPSGLAQNLRNCIQGSSVSNEQDLGLTVQDVQTTAQDINASATHWLLQTLAIDCILSLLSRYGNSHYTQANLGSPLGQKPPQQYITEQQASQADIGINRTLRCGGIVSWLAGIAKQYWASGSWGTGNPLVSDSLGWKGRVGPNRASRPPRIEDYIYIYMSSMHSCD